MKSIARWSSKHVFAARLLIAICHILLAYIACFVGNSLKLYDQNIPILIFWLSAAVFALAFLTAPKKVYRRFSFYKRKCLDFAVILFSFMMIVTLANQRQPLHFISYTSVQGSLSTAGTNPIDKPTFKELKKQYQEFRHFIKKDKPSLAAVIGAILLGLVLAALVLSAACSLSCNGQDGLAVLVLLGGAAGIFFLVKLLLKPRKREPKRPESDLSQ